MSIHFANLQRFERLCAMMTDSPFDARARSHDRFRDPLELVHVVRRGNDGDIGSLVRLATSVAKNSRKIGRFTFKSKSTPPTINERFLSSMRRRAALAQKIAAEKAKEEERSS